MKSISMDRRGLTALVILTFGLAMAGVSVAGTCDHGPQIMTMQEEYYGQTYSELAVKWWQWALGTPADINPVIDDTGEFCASGQEGQVWFLATTLGTNPGVVRSCTIPPGKALFFPLINSSDNMFPGEDPVPEAQLRATANCGIPTELAAEIDGVSIKNLYQYFEHSPVYQVPIPAGDIFGIGPIVLGPSVDQGYYLLLKPLPKGEHKIHWKATWTCPWAPDTPFTEEVTYYLTVGAGHHR